IADPDDGFAVKGFAGDSEGADVGAAREIVILLAVGPGVTAQLGWIVDGHYAHCHSFDYNRGIISTGGAPHATAHTLSFDLLLHLAGTDEEGDRQPVSRNVEGAGSFRAERADRFV